MAEYTEGHQGMNDNNIVICVSITLRMQVMGNC